MGNECCSTPGYQLGFNPPPGNFDFLNLKIDNTSTLTNDPKKSMNIYIQAFAAQEVKSVNKAKKALKIPEAKMSSQQITPSPISCPMPSASKPQGISDSQYGFELTEQNQQFLQKYRILSQRILETIIPEKSMLSIKKWQNLLESLDGIYLTVTDRMQLIKSLHNLVKVEMGVEFNKEERDFNFLDEDYSIDEQDFCDETGKQLMKVKKRVKNRKAQTMQVFSFMRDFSSYKTDFSDIKKVAKRAFSLCKKDINAFSFVTLYLYSSINQKLNQNPQNTFQIVEKLEKIINDLSVIYPPNSFQIEEEENIEEEDDVHSNYDTCIKYPMIKFQSDDVGQRRNQVFEQISRRIVGAKTNKLQYDALLKQICLEKGKYFQSVLKIKNSSPENLISILRVYEKIVLNEQNENLKKWIEQKKKEIVEQLTQNQQFNKIKIFNQCWGDVLVEMQRSMVQNKKQIPFCVGDLLRGKAIFKRKSHISKTVKLIEQKFSQLNSSKYSILQTENRLEKPTKDFKIIFMIEDTIAQLQLAMEMNKEQNQFNHKLYELKRGKGFGSFMNLWMMNQRLSEFFFDDQLELCCFMVQRKDETYVAGMENLQAFVQQTLSKNVAAYSNQGEELEDQRVFTKDRESMLESIEENFNAIQNLLQGGYVQNCEFARDGIRKANDLTFMKLKFM